MPADLRSSDLKIYRAIKHFDDLNAQIVAFQQLNPYRIVVDDDSEPAIRIYKMGVVEGIPSPGWSVYIGDVLHNIMSTLDSLATSLVERGGHGTEEILKNTYF